MSAYEIGADRIIVRFRNGSTYVYDYAKTGREDVNRMIALARAGRGLSTFISRVVRDRYSERVR